MFIKKEGKNMNESMNVTGERLKELRQALGLSKTQVAEQLGLLMSSYYTYEKQGRALPYSIALQIARYYDVDVAYILGETDEK